MLLGYCGSQASTRTSAELPVTAFGIPPVGLGRALRHGLLLRLLLAAHAAGRIVRDAEAVCPTASRKSVLAPRRVRMIDNAKLIPARDCSLLAVARHYAFAQARRQTAQPRPPKRRARPRSWTGLRRPVRHLRPGGAAARLSGLQGSLLGLSQPQSRRVPRSAGARAVPGFTMRR